MDTININALIQQMKVKEEREAANAKKIKECEAAIKLEEENIKKYQGLRNKLSQEIKIKLVENSKKETTFEILLQKKLIWLNLLDKTRNDLKNEEAKLEALQQNVCSNRISFCNNVGEFLDKNCLLPTSGKFAKKGNDTLATATIKVKTEEEADEYKNLVKEKQNLETELGELNTEEARIEKAKQLKLHLQAEPSSGENFLKLQKGLKDIKEELTTVENNIKNVKSRISQAELNLLNQSEKKKNSEVNVLTSSDIFQHSQPGSSKENARNIRKTIRKGPSKIVKFKDSVEIQRIPSTPILHRLLTSKPFIANTPSPSLRNQLSQKLVSKLDKEMKDIIFQEKN